MRKHVKIFEELYTTNGIPILEYHDENEEPNLYHMYKLAAAGMMDIDRTWLGNHVFAIRTELNNALDYLKEFDYKNAVLCMEEVEHYSKKLKEAIDWAQQIKDEAEYVPEPEDDERVGTP